MQANAIYASESNYTVNSVQTSETGMTKMLWVKLAVSLALIASPICVIVMAVA